MKIINHQFEFYSTIIKLIDRRNIDDAEIALVLVIEKIIDVGHVNIAKDLLRHLTTHDPFLFPIHPAATTIMDIKALLYDHLSLQDD